jgi:hypothetical protein
MMDYDRCLPSVYVLSLFAMVAPHDDPARASAPVRDVDHFIVVGVRV